jgi:hypothetical protein
LLRREGWQVNRKRTYRLYRDAGKAARARTHRAAQMQAEVIADAALIITLTGERYRAVKARKLAVIRKES